MEKNMPDFNPCIIIPVYKHGKACVSVVERLKKYNIQLILVDDGNGAENRSYLEKILLENSEFVDLVTLPKNQGKGGAFKAGIIRAHERGFSHAIQIDADGQHDERQIPFFLEKSAASPEKMICGYPVYDESAPAARKNGRKFANNWCKIVSLESGIKDSLCGFRIYPVEAAYDFVENHAFDFRMGFDIEIFVKLIWAGVKYEFYPVHVSYPSDGISNFRAVRDNARISWVFTRLFCGMILRLPLLIGRKIL